MLWVLVEKELRRCLSFLTGNQVSFFGGVPLENERVVYLCHFDRIAKLSTCGDLLQ